MATLRDRVVQMALKLVLEPIFEPDQYQSSYAYRPGRRTWDAVAEVVHFINNGYQWVIEGDVENCFDAILRGVANYFRFAAGKRTLHYLGYYAWWRVMRWLRAKHPKATWTWLRKRYFGKDKLAEAGVTLFRPDSVKVASYRYRGTKIATPWNTEQMQATRAAFPHVIDERAGLEWLQGVLFE